MLNHEEALNDVFHALADPTRRAIVTKLSASNATVSELAQPLDMSLAAVVQHIQLLEKCRVITTRKVGRSRTCSLEPQAFSLVEGWLTERRMSWEHAFDQLGTILNDETP